MKHWSEEDRIILRRLARKVQKAIHDRWDDAGVYGKDSSKAAGIRDKIAREEFLRVEPLLKPRFRFSDLLYYVGIAEGKIKDPDEV